jgi:hypothetical protein
VCCVWGGRGVGGKYMYKDARSTDLHVFNLISCTLRAAALSNVRMLCLMKRK